MKKIATIGTLKIAGIVGAVTSCFLVSACNNQVNTQSDNKSVAESEEIDYTQQSGELVFQSLGGGIEESFHISYGNFLKKKFPNLKITFIQAKAGSTLPELAAAGQHVDVVYHTIDNIAPALLQTGFQMDITDLAREHRVDLGKYDQTLLDGIKAMGGGKIYFLPVTNMIQVLFYNKDLFDKFGVDYPKDGMTWEEAAELSQKLTRSQDGINYMGLSMSPDHILRMNQLSVPVYDPVAKTPMFTDARWNTLLDTYFLQINTPNLTDFTSQHNRLPYIAEMTDKHILSMYVFNSMFPFDGPEYVANMNWDLASLPVFKDKPGVGSMASPVMFAITNVAKNKAFAMEAIKFLGSAEMQMVYSKQGFMTVLNDDNIKNQIGTESQYKGKNWMAVYKNKMAPLTPRSAYNANILRFLNDGIPKLVTNQLDSNTLLRDAQEKAVKYLEAELAK